MNADEDQVVAARKWVERADEDFKTALHLNREKQDWTSRPVCFHCQQASEKYLKALLQSQGEAPSRGHDLLELYRKVPNGIDLNVPLNILATLNRYAIETRYPGEWDPISVDDAAEALEMSRRLRTAIKHALPPGAKGEP